jgi:hypothetical protein
MPRERGPLQALAHPSALADKISRRIHRISTRHIPLVEFCVTYSKHRYLLFSTRHTLGSMVSARPCPLLKMKGANLLTPVRHLLYIWKVLEETGGPRAASNNTYCRGAGLVGAGIGHRFKDSFFTTVQKLSLKIFAGVSLPGTFAFTDNSVRTARPHTSEEA